jgi:serine/threonine protein kinase
MSQITCLRCKQQIDAEYDLCPHCSERVTNFQRTYASRLLDGKYQIIDRLGVGGMGEIFKVRHIHLNELRVVKIMRPNIASDDQALQRFLQEARTSTTIKHKNLAMLYDFAQLEDGSYYMVWEFIDGTNIQKWIGDHGAMPPRLTVEIAAQALSGLDHLHSMGLIHRDISPENIMLSQDHHGKLLVKVIDFGIAKQLAEGEGSQGLTQTGMFLGKLKYASPEQAGFLKEGDHLDPRSDLYSFGIVMYEMLAGRAPFQATNPHGYILKHVTEKPARIQELNPAARVPPALEAIVMRSLEKNRDDRYATADDFASAIEAVRSSIPPDQKYGLGEKMITLSGAQTLADLPKMTGTGTGTTGPRSGSDAETLIERSFTAPGVKPSKDQATVIERLGTAAPTAIEEKWSGGAAGSQPAVVSGGLRARRSTSIAIAAVVVIALLIGGYFMLNKPKPVEVVTTPTTTTATPPVTTSTVAIPGGQGVLLLSASPWADLEKIVSNSDQKEIALDERSTPVAIPLEPGSYAVTVKGPSGTQTDDVNIVAGQPTKKFFDMGGVDYDKLAEEVSKQ